MKVSKTLKAGFSRLVLLLTFFCVSLSAKAVDWIDLQLGTEYEVPNFGKFYGKFTAPKAGIVNVSFTGGSTAPKPFYDEELEQGVDYANSSMGYDFVVTAGTNYYIGTDWAQQGGTMVLTMASDEGIKLTEASPAEGSVLDLGAGAQVNLLFNMNITVSSGALVYGNNQSAALSVHTQGNTVTSELRTVLYTLLQNGKVKAGDELTVRLKGLRSSSDASLIYGNDSVFDIKYICPELPISLVEEKSISTFYSYWFPGDESGIMRLTFSGELDPTAAKVTFSYGNAESSSSGEYYTESVPYTVDGCTLSVDFTGTVRDPKAMITSGTIYSVCTISITNVRDVNGNYAYSPNSGALGSFSEQPAYKVASGDYLCEITPETGSDLSDANEIEIWLRGTDNVHYDGIQVAYTDASGRHEEQLTEADYTAEVIGGNEPEVTYTIAVKKAWKDASDVVVSLLNFISKTGETGGVEAKYNAFVVTGINPEQGSTLGFLNRGDVISVSTNRSKKIKSFVYEVHDLNAASSNDYVIKTMSYLSPNADSTVWKSTNYGNYKFYTGHKYSFVFKAFASNNIHETPLGIDSVVVNGGTQPYVYSDILFESISPVVGSTISDVTENHFVITFDGLVNINSETSFVNVGQGFTQSFDEIKNLVDDSEYSYKWEVVVPESYLKTYPGSMSLTVVAVDMQGKRVQGNQGEDEGSYFSFSYTNTVGVPKVTCTYPTEGETVEELSYIILSCSKGIVQSYATGAKLTLINANTNEVAATVSSVTELGGDNFDEMPTQVKLELNTTVTESGSYYMEIPEAYFYLGSAANYSSTALTVNVVIGNPTGINTVAADKATARSIFDLQGHRLSNVNRPGIYVIDGKMQVVR
jgi:hypothetical protein